eukprot:TRINITY_DN5949_c0_g1_i2.p2 TRINITY_DN5949_c0_g1~~TRINITY_DN5949_c0_g1_i2.p2  ORF type:complete len:114 (+),score=14.36 TRINITY_DN5949_c0_g1_i2:212-553(+)
MPRGHHWQLTSALGPNREPIYMYIRRVSSDSALLGGAPVRQFVGVSLRSALPVMMSVMSSMMSSMMPSMMPSMVTAVMTVVTSVMTSVMTPVVAMMASVMAVMSMVGTVVVVE